MRKGLLVTKLVVATPVKEAERLEPADDRPDVGSWWWVKGRHADDEDPDTQNSKDIGRAHGWYPDGVKK